MKYVFLVVMLFFGVVASAKDAVVRASPDQCAQGLYAQPVGGPFSVFLFCDGALGVNIGVVNTAPGAGPGKIPLTSLKVWGKWDVNDRFWQDPVWATDVTSFAWSADLRYLYVATDSIYGNGGLYRLNLANRSYKQLLPRMNARNPADGGHKVMIMKTDSHTGLLTVSDKFFSARLRRQETIKYHIK